MPFRNLCPSEESGSQIVGQESSPENPRNPLRDQYWTSPARVKVKPALFAFWSSTSHWT